MKRLLVITSNKHDPNPVKIARAGEQRGLEIELVEYSELTLQFQGGGLHVVSHSLNNDFTDFDYYIFRGSGVRNYVFQEHRGVLASWLAAQGKRVLNGTYFSEYCGGTSKLVQHMVMVDKKLPCVPTTIVGSLDAYPHLLPDYPYVVKPTTGSHGEGVTLVDSDSARRRIFTFYSAHELLIQPVLPGRNDFRIITIGNRALGMMERTAQKGAFVTNVSAGGKASKATLTGEMERLALRAAEAFSLEYAGIDIMLQDGEPVVLEVNSAAEFQGFAKATGIDVASEIVRYLTN
jgi:RimK family alpha-L-glutamate ligase